jgi:nitroreductase
LFESARWAPSSYNEQPWRYVYATKDDGAAREKIESLLLPGNAWAKGVGLLLVSFYKKTFTYNGKPNVHGLHDLGCATGYMMLQCESLGLVGHQMAGFKTAEANALLGIPDDFAPGSMIAIGYPGNPASLPEELRKREETPRTRNEMHTFAFRGSFTQS